MEYVLTALFVSLLWGISPICFKYAMSQGVEPPLILSISAGTYFVCMLAFATINWEEIRNNTSSLSWTMFGILVATSVFTAFVANMLFLRVLSKRSSYITTALVYSSPAFTMLIAWSVLREDVTVTGFIGVVLVILGVLCIAAA